MVGISHRGLLKMKHPYVASPGPLVKAFEQFRKSLPSSITAGTLKKLAIAPNNESYLLNTLRFLGLVNEEGERTDDARKLFTQHADEAFASSLATLVERAYTSLFELHGEHTWSLGKPDLVAFFRNEDESTAIVGERQAATFITLAALSGHGGKPAPASATRANVKGAGAHGRAAKARAASASAARSTPLQGSGAPPSADGRIGLTVRIEINLPAVEDQAVYDKIFKSLRSNLINGA